MENLNKTETSIKKKYRIDILVKINEYSDEKVDNVFVSEMLRDAIIYGSDFEDYEVINLYEVV